VRSANAINVEDHRNDVTPRIKPVDGRQITRRKMSSWYCTSHDGALHEDARRIALAQNVNRWHESSIERLQPKA
jgi:hypothetical protein